MHLRSKRWRFLNMQQLGFYLNSSGKLKAKPLKSCQIALQREFIRWVKIEKVSGDTDSGQKKKKCSYLFEQDEMSFKVSSKPNQSGIPWFSHGSGFSKASNSVYTLLQQHKLWSPKVYVWPSFSIIFNTLVPSFPLKKDFSLWSRSKVLIHYKDLEFFFLNE